MDSQKSVGNILFYKTPHPKTKFISNVYLPQRQR